MSEGGTRVPAQMSGETSAQGRPGRYPRSASGLVGALIILLAVIVGFVVVRAVTRDELEIRPDHVDYLSVVRDVQGAGVEVVYPESLPDGWFASGVDRAQAAEDESDGPSYGPEWGISLLTDDDQYAGVRQLMVASPSEADRGRRAMLRRLVDEEAVEGDEIRIDSDVSGSWSTWTDAGGDTAYVARLGDDWVMVYGSAPASQLRDLAARLTTEPAPAP